MSEENKKLLDLTQKYMGVFLTCFGGIVSFITGVYCLWEVSQNYLKSTVYHVDFSFFQISFDFYKFLLLSLLLFSCYLILRSFLIVLTFLWKRFVKKLHQDFFWSDMLLVIFFVIILLIFGFLANFSVSLTLLFLVFLFGFTLMMCFKFFVFSDKLDKKNEKKPFNVKAEVKNLLPLFGIVMLIELLISLFTFSTNYGSKDKYYIIDLGEEDKVEVVIETYPNYYITKEAHIVDNFLYIHWTSQRISDPKRSFAYEKKFEKIYFDYEK